MQSLDNNIQAFIVLVSAGLWEKDVRLCKLKDIDYNVIYRLAEEQSVIGLVAAGLEHVQDVKVSQDVLLKFVGMTLQIEQRNRAMNMFVASLIERLRENDVYALLVKGQGIAQCYERPLWRACGDVDLFLSENNYQKAKSLLQPMASYVEVEYKYNKHIALTIDSWLVELHGNLRGDVLRKIDKVLDIVKNDFFYCGNLRSWTNSNTQVYLPGVDEDVFFVFSHILDHFYHGGIGLRQVCDWCRLLWTHRGKINNGLLEDRLRKAGIMTEWKAFAALAVNYLGVPADSIPLCSDSKIWKKKARDILGFIIKTGNFGNNRETVCQKTNSNLLRKAISFYSYTLDSVVIFSIFPLDSIKVWLNRLFRGVENVLNDYC